MNFIFKYNNYPLYTASLPEGYRGEAVFRPLHYDMDNTDNFEIFGSAVSPDRKYNLFFQTGHSFSGSSKMNANDIGKENGIGVIQTDLCTVQDQINDYAYDFLDKPVTTRFFQPIPNADELTIKCNAYIQRTFGDLQQASARQSTNVQLLNIINDGATGIYHLPEGKILLVSLWRCGTDCSLSSFALAPLRMWSWSVPLVTYMMADEPLEDDGFFLYYDFLKTLKETPELKSYREEMKRQNTMKASQVIAREQQKTQQINDMLWQKHNQAWDRAERVSKQLSADMDAFHQQQQARLQQSSHPISSGSGESLDDKIQRQRHEAMMGVNTYVDEDGRETEHTIMNDRVFESNLDQNVHFGTEHYYDDYVPDGWHEIFRKE